LRVAHQVHFGSRFFIRTTWDRWLSLRFAGFSRRRVLTLRKVPMTLFGFTIPAVHTWHDALLWIVVAGCFALFRIPVILAKRVTMVSLPKREARFQSRK
jgi:hypothetical protein